MRQEQPRFRIDRPMPPWSKAIVADCCREHGLRPDIVLSESRKLKVVACRQDIYHRIRQRPNGPSLARIGQWFGRHHATVLHALRRRERLTRFTTTSEDTIG